MVYLMSGGFRVRRGNLAGGDRGTGQTLRIMRSLAHEGMRQLPIQATAIGVVRQAGVRPHDHRGEAVALFRFVRDGIHFVNDPDGVETLRGPRATLALGGGDCDDKATLLAGLLGAIGIPSSFKVIAADRRMPGQFSHVYVVAHLPNGQHLPLDPTYRETPAGWQLPNPYRMAEVPA